jgi:hypothetical protein
MIGFIGTSLKLQSIITAHTLNSFLTTFVCRTSMKDLLNSKSKSKSLEFTNELPYITAREPNRDHRLQGFHYCSSWMRCLRNVHEPLPTKWTIPCLAPLFRLLAVFIEPLSSKWCFRLVITETCVSEPMSSNGLFERSGLMSHNVPG